MSQDSADLDGDGEFNAIDITILEEGESKTSAQNKNTGCCLPFLIVGSSITGAAFIINKIIS